MKMSSIFIVNNVSFKEIITSIEPNFLMIEVVVVIVVTQMLSIGLDSVNCILELILKIEPT